MKSQIYIINMQGNVVSKCINSVKETEKEMRPVKDEGERGKDESGESIRVDNKSIFTQSAAHGFFVQYHTSHLSKNCHHQCHKSH